LAAVYNGEVVGFQMLDNMLGSLGFVLINDSPEVKIYKRDFMRHGGTYPSVSVIVATIERESLTKCLESICDYDYNNYEVIVVLDRKRNVAYARNRAMEFSRGYLIHFIDDDAVASRENLSEMVNTWIRLSSFDPKIGGLQGNIEGFRAPWNTNKMITKISLTPAGIRPELFKGEGLTDFVIACNALFSAGVLKMIGGFDEQIDYQHDDIDLSFLIRHAGCSLYATEKGEVVHLEEISNLDESFHRLFHAEKNSVILYFKWAKISTFALYVLRRVVFLLVRVLTDILKLDIRGMRRDVTMLFYVFVGLRKLPRTRRMRR